MRFWLHPEALPRRRAAIRLRLTRPRRPARRVVKLRRCGNRSFAERPTVWFTARPRVDALRIILTASITRSSSTEEELNDGRTIIDCTVKTYASMRRASVAPLTTAATPRDDHSGEPERSRRVPAAPAALREAPGTLRSIPSRSATSPTTWPPLAASRLQELGLTCTTGPQASGQATRRP